MPTNTAPTESDYASRISSGNIWRTDLLTGIATAPCNPSFIDQISNYPKVSTPALAAHTVPSQPRIPIGFFAQWAADMTIATAFCNADQWGQLFDFLSGNYYRMKLADAPGGKQAAGAAAAKLRFGTRCDFLDAAWFA
jgi:hypothetical protein